MEQTDYKDRQGSTALLGRSPVGPSQVVKESRAESSRLGIAHPGNLGRSSPQRQASLLLLCLEIGFSLSPHGTVVFPTVRRSE